MHTMTVTQFLYHSKRMLYWRIGTGAGCPFCLSYNNPKKQGWAIPTE